MKLWCGGTSLLYTVQWQSINCKRKPNKTLVAFFQEERVFLHKPRLLTFIYLKWKGERGDLKEKYYLRAIENIPSSRKQGGSDEGNLIPHFQQEVNLLFFIYLFLAGLGLGCCEDFSQAAPKRGYPSPQAAPLAEPGSGARGFSRRGAWVPRLPSAWDFLE